MPGRTGLQTLHRSHNAKSLFHTVATRGKLPPTMASRLVGEDRLQTSTANKTKSNRGNATKAIATKPSLLSPHPFGEAIETTLAIVNVIGHEVASWLGKKGK